MSNPATAVVVISHNYGRFLREAVESVLGQISRPTEVLVVDDSSTDDTAAVAATFAARGVTYLRGEWRNVYPARAAGLAATTAPIVCFLDADDRLPRDYLEDGLPRFANPKIGVVYSDMKCFGDSSNLETKPPFDRDALQRDNFIHAGSLVRRVALETSAAFDADHHVVAATHADWFVWRRVVNVGWDAIKQSATYHYRKHAGSMMANRPRLEDRKYYLTAGLALEPLTLAIPLAGRAALWPALAEWLDQQTWPKSQIRLRLYDTSQSFGFGLEIDDWIRECDFPDVGRVRLTVADPGLADENRRDQSVQQRVRAAMARIYNRVLADCSTEYLWVVEDDILPPTDAAEQLLRGFDPTTASVSGAYRSRFNPGWVAWSTPGKHISVGSGIATVGGNGFGCVILRRSIASKYVFHHSDRRGYDENFYSELSTSKAFKSKINWGCVCEHRENERTEIKTAH